MDPIMVEAKKLIKTHHPQYKALVAKNKKLDGHDADLILLQLQIITLLDAEVQTVIHTTCRNQDLELLRFFIEKAGPNYLNVLDKIIDAKDELDITPIYMLCEAGFDDDEKVE